MVNKWIEIDSKVVEFEGGLEIPNEKLDDVNEVTITRLSDLEDIPKEGGCYWIWTTELIKHSLHPNWQNFPKPVRGGEIIYNGISKDDIRGRIQKHLFGKVNEGMSAIGVDILLEKYEGSHRKKAFCIKGKAPYLDGNKITCKEQFLNVNLSDEERSFVNASNFQIHFRNGINISESKHLDFVFKVYFLAGFKSASYGDIIEKEWRKRYGLPKLCSYRKGR